MLAINGVDAEVSAQRPGGGSVTSAHARPLIYRLPLRRPAAVGPRHPPAGLAVPAGPPAPAGPVFRGLGAGSAPPPPLHLLPGAGAPRGGRGGAAWRGSERRCPRKLARQEGRRGRERSLQSSSSSSCSPGPAALREERQRRGPMRRPGRRSPPPGPSSTISRRRRR